MTQTHPKPAPGERRNHRRRDSGRQAWERPMRSFERAVYASWRLIDSSVRIVRRCDSTAHRRPIRASRQLETASSRLTVAHGRLASAAAHLAKTTRCMAREPELPRLAPVLAVESAQRLAYAIDSLAQASRNVDTMQENLLVALESGVIRPEPLPALRRIRLTPPPAPVRTFLLVRQPRVIDRIAPVLRRRRRTPRPAEVRVPRRSLLGRAPPLVSIALV